MLKKYNLNEYDMDILICWFGIKFSKNHDNSTLVNFWKNMWFCKNSDQIKIDKYLHPNNSIYSQIAHIVLYDQISRNIFRGTIKAYKYDEYAIEIVKHILENYTIDRLFTLNIQFIVVIMLCMAHSEDLEIHETLTIMINFFKEKFMRTHYTICPILAELIERHTFRIEQFGRIPERNKFTGRQSTVQESAFLNVL